jgi:hypothetical protein
MFFKSNISLPMCVKVAEKTWLSMTAGSTQSLS